MQIAMKRPSKKKISLSLCVALLPLLSGCQKYYLSLTDQNINVDYLASTHVATPDKRQHNPPYGQMIVMDWRVPKDVLDKAPTLDLYVIYGNYTEQKFHYPIETRMGFKTYKDLNQEFVDKKGIIAYRAEIRLSDGSIYKSWKHQLWAELITIDEPASPVDLHESKLALLRPEHIADQQNGINLANESADEGEIKKDEDKDQKSSEKEDSTSDGKQSSSEKKNNSSSKKFLVDQQNGINLANESTDEGEIKEDEDKDQKSSEKEDSTSDDKQSSSEKKNNAPSKKFIVDEEDGIDLATESADEGEIKEEKPKETTPSSEKSKESQDSKKKQEK